MTILAQAADDNLLDEVRNFFDSTPWLLFRNLTLFLVAIIWLASVFWVYKDARRRIGDPWLVAMATLLGAFPPFLGPFLYLLFRPPEYLADVRERELEIEAMEAQLRRSRCLACTELIQPDFLACPYCATSLKDPCRNCQRPLEKAWQVCPYCQQPATAPTVSSLEAQRERPAKPRRRKADPAPSPTTPA